MNRWGLTDVEFSRMLRRVERLVRDHRSAIATSTHAITKAEEVAALTAGVADIVALELTELLPSRVAEAIRRKEVLQ